MKTWMLLFIACVLCVSASGAYAADMKKDAHLHKLQPLFSQAATRWDIPEGLLWAIAKQESSHNPLILNIAGKDVHPKTREAALQMAGDALAAGKSFDVGLMQINSYWIKKLKLSLGDVLDPENNVHIGAWILKQEIKRYGLNWKAIGSYHHPVTRNANRSFDYAQRVLRHWERSLSKKEQNNA